MGFLMGLVYAYGWSVIIGSFFGLASVIVLILWKFNCAIYDKMLKLPALFCKFILRPLLFACCFIWQLIRDPGALLHLLWLIITVPFAIAWGIFMGIFDFLRHPIGYITGKRKIPSPTQELFQSTKKIHQTNN